MHPKLLVELTKRYEPKTHSIEEIHDVRITCVCACTYMYNTYCATTLKVCVYLCQQFFRAATGLYIHESIMSIFNHAMTECTHAKLY